MGLLVASCMSFDPVSENEISSPLVVEEGGAKSTGDTAWATCQACASQACPNEWAMCKQTPKCEPFYECGARSGCYAPDASPSSCLVQCALPNFVLSQTDPAVAPFQALEQCSTMHCVDACKGPT